VYPDLVLAPRWDGLAVIERGADALTLRGVVGVAGGALRGFPHGTGLVAVGSEQVVSADALTLDVIGRVTIAENVVDVGRLDDGTLLRLVQTGEYARLNGAEVTLWAEALYPHENAAAIVGWDMNGRVAYVVTFDQDPPRVSARLNLNSANTPITGGVKDGIAADFAGGGAAIFAPAFSGAQEVMTTSGKLVLRGIPAGSAHTFGQGDLTDGLIVVDIAQAALGKGIAVRDAAITGLAADGNMLAFTMATYAGQDDLDRPLLNNEYLRIDLDSGEQTAPVSVPGYVVAADGPDVYTVEEAWGENWSVTSQVVASRMSAGVVSVLDRLALPEGAYDLRAAGGTLFFSSGGGLVRPMVYDAIGGAGLWLPDSHIGTVRLGAALALGAEISGNDAFRTLLLAEDGAALITRDGLAAERWDLSGATATLDWSESLSGYPLRAHADTAYAGHYLLALGYAGELSLP
jgi:hypothetical protein